MWKEGGGDREREREMCKGGWTGREREKEKEWRAVSLGFRAAGGKSRTHLAHSFSQSGKGPSLRTREMEIEKEMKKVTLGHEIGAGAPCLKCQEKCEGFELHFWRKICRNCKCGLEDHDVQLTSEESRKVGRLFEDTKYTSLLGKLKKDGVPTYRGNMVTVTSVAPAKKDVGVKSVTYEWAPPVSNQSLAVRYIEMLPKEKQPVAGTEGATYRKRQLAKQLPEHDQDPSKCHELSPAEVKQMRQYVKKYKEEALGVGDVKLPEEVMSQAQAGGMGGPGAGERASAVVVPTVGTAGGPAAPGAQSTPADGPTYSCHRCQQPMERGDPAVYAERAGYDSLWHPACFVCCVCSELLVDMIYFWKKGQPYCGRHYGESEKPRCSGCDELIFSSEYTQAEGLDWHLKHFCCFDCDRVLAGETYVMEKEKPVCKPCYMENHAVHCASCQEPVDPEAQRVTYGGHSWHAEPRCFRCSCCSKCLVGERFMAVQDSLFCSVECRKKTTTT
uniref:Testin LIM domain protein n=2 Tax=Scleropages formosus TaxID=113540 RepID=A0A8C9RWT4_SCLFO